jgi:hypothetical protein
MADQQALVPTERRIARRSVNTFHRVQQVAGVAIGLAVVGIWSGGTLAAVIGYPLIGLYFAGAVVFAKRQARRFVVENQTAQDAMQRGELAKAHEIWDYWSDIASNKRIMVIACHNLATIWIHQGKLAEAKKLHLENSEFELKWLERTALAKLSAASVAYTAALLGELDLAANWVAVAERRGGGPQVPNADTTVVLARVLIELRRGRTAEATKLLADNWTLLENRLSATSLRGFRVLRAFARSAEGPREAGNVHEDVAAARPKYVGEYRYYGVAWPEMATFLAANGY